MKQAIELLVAEHRTIETVLTALESYATSVAAGDDVEQKDLQRFVLFIRDYVDGIHHDKEETILFPAMNECGFPREAGPVAVMLHEHDVGRGFVATLSELAGCESAWSPEERSRLVDAAQSFSQLLRNHIHKENNVLYPMALNALPAEAQNGVRTACAERQKEAESAGMVEALEGLGRELVSRYSSN